MVDAGITKPNLQTDNRITVTQFEQMDNLPPTAQLIEGEIFIVSHPIVLHNDVVLETASFLRDLRVRIGGKTHIAPMGVYLDEYNKPQPDVIWRARGSRCIDAGKRLEGPPELVIEVLSPSTALVDRDVKFRLYERFDIGEYWIIDCVYALIEVYVLHEGQYKRLGVYDRAGSFASPALSGERVPVNALFPSQEETDA